MSLLFFFVDFFTMLACVFDKICKYPFLYYLLQRETRECAVSRKGERV